MSDWTGQALPSAAGGSVSPAQSAARAATLSPQVLAPGEVARQLGLRPQDSPAFAGMATTGVADNSFYSAAGLRLAFEGDSLSAEGEDKWPRRMIECHRYFKAASASVFSTPGQTAVQMVTQYASEAHTVSPSVAGGRGVFFLWAGTNDLYGGATAEAIYENLKTLWAAAKADGYRVVAFTLTPRTSEASDAPKLAQRLALNALILSDPSLYDILIRPELILPDPTSADYFADGLHFTRRGYLMIAAHVAGRLLAFDETTAGHTHHSGDVIVQGRLTASAINGLSPVSNPTFAGLTLGESGGGTRALILNSDVAGKYGYLFTLAGGHVYLMAMGDGYSCLGSQQGSPWIFSGPGKPVLIDGGTQALFRDVGASNATRMSFDFPTATLTVYGPVVINGVKCWGKLAAAPSNPGEGDEYYNSATHKKYVYDGTQWMACW